MRPHSLDRCAPQIWAEMKTRAEQLITATAPSHAHDVWRMDLSGRNPPDALAPDLRVGTARLRILLNVKRLDLTLNLADFLRPSAISSGHLRFAHEIDASDRIFDPFAAPPNYRPRKIR